MKTEILVYIENKILRNHCGHYGVHNFKFLTVKSQQ